MPERGVRDYLDLATWNAILLDWFFPAAGPHAAFLRADAAELRFLNDDLALGLNDPVDNLVHAAQLYRDLMVAAWARDPAGTAPPFLTHLAVSVLVVEEQLERGSYAFYEPLSKRLSSPTRISQEEYRSTYFDWWLRLARWLEHDLGGERGLPTWRRIPKAGPRSIVGHPYTQVLLRREDRDVLDEFLESVWDLDAHDLEITDDAAAAAVLLRQFTRWAQRSRGVSSRLLHIVISGTKDDRDSLGFMLLDRMTSSIDARSNDPPRTSTLRIVPTLDEWSRRVRLAVVAPASVSPAKPLRLEPYGLPPIELDEPGQPVELQLAVQLDESETFRTRSGYDLALRPANEFVLARRDWNEWVAIRDPEPGETVYVLTTTRLVDSLGARFDGLTPREFDGVPAGWIVVGPGSVRGEASGEHPVPRVSGGLALRTARTFVHGGEPRLDLPDGHEEVRVDGRLVSSAGGSVDLSTLALDIGEHRIDCGPFSITFRLEAPSTDLPFEPEVGIDRAGAIQPFGPDIALTSGLAGLGPLAPVDRLHPCCPPDGAVFLLGDPGAVAAVAPTISWWASQEELEPNVFDPDAYSSYLPAGRPKDRPSWVVGGLDREPWILRTRHSSVGHPVVGDLERWRDITERTGERPRVVPLDDASADEVLVQWQQYRLARAS